MIATSIEQSKKLLDLGIDPNTADMCYIDGNDKDCQVKDGTLDDEDIYAWSLSALMNLLPSEFTEVDKYPTTKYEIEIRKYKFTDEVNLHQIAYGSYKWYEDGGYTWKDMISTGEKEDFLDAAFEMVCWLKENGKI